jgi:hypothetical protein
VLPRLGLVLSLLPAASVVAGLSTPEDAIREAKAAGTAKDRVRVEQVLREAHQKWPNDLSIQSYLGAVLFSTGRVEESLPLLKRVCESGGHEAACAVSVGINLVRNNWDHAFSIASRFSETACQRSDRTWTMKLLASRSPHAEEVASRLVTAAPADELSYLFLAAAQWERGEYGEATKTIEVGRQRSLKVVLLKRAIDWPRNRSPVPRSR